MVLILRVKRSRIFPMRLNSSGWFKLIALAQRIFYSLLQQKLIQTVRSTKLSLQNFHLHLIYINLEPISNFPNILRVQLNICKLL